MATTKGSQRYIGESAPDAKDVRQSEPEDFLKLCLNSNDNYSRYDYPNNNCYNFTIKFPQGSADSIQYRITQCSHYQVVNLRTPIRGNKAIQTSYYAQVPFHSQVIKDTPTLPLTPGGAYNTKFGKMTRVQYTQTHEELEKLHLRISYAPFNQQMNNEAERNFLKKLPPIKKFISYQDNKEIVRLRECQAMLYFNAKCHASQRELHFSRYALYPPNPHNVLNMYTKKFTNQVYTTNFTSHLINSNALFYEQSYDHLLQSQPPIIQPNGNIYLSPTHVQLFPNESQLTYDTHHFDEPAGLETDITIIFYKEDELFERHKWKIINQ